MAEYNKEKLYFLKLPKDFFQSYKMRALEGLQSGKDYELMYLKLICESVSHNGYLRFDEKTPYTAEMIAGITNTPIDTVRVGIAVLQQFGLVEMTDAMTIYMPEVPNMTGSTTEGAKRKSLYRQRQTSLPQPDGTKGGQEGDICPPREIRELDNGLSTNVSKPTENLRESTSSPKGSSVSSRINQYEPVKSPDELLSMMVENGFITESESLDPCWGKFLKDFTHDRQDELGEAEGYIDAKVKLRHVLKSVSTYKAVGEDRNGKPIFAYRADDSLKSIGAKFPWFIKAMRKAVEQMDASEKVRVDWQEALSESQSQDDDEAF